MIVGPVGPMVLDCFTLRGNCQDTRVCFKPACDGHDQCYGACLDSQRVCDDRFRNGMLKVCARTFSAPGAEACRTKCMERAEVYYWAVKIGGIVIYSCPGADFSSSVTVFAEFALARYAVDSDLDLLPDAWEQSVGLNPHDTRDAVKDTDGDLLPNLLEFIHDLDPRKNDSDGDGRNDMVEVLAIQPS